MLTETTIAPDCTLWRSSRGRGAVIPADGCVDVIAHASGLLLAGPSTRPITTRADGASGTLGIRLAPGAATPLLPFSPAEVRDLTIPLSDALGARPARRLERLLAAQAAAPAAPVIAAELERLATPADRWVQLARRAAHAQLPASQLARSLGCSPRSLRRRMLASFGYGYATLVRIERARLARSLVAAGSDLAAAAVAAGYADQSHMTREFVRVAGIRPGQLVGSAA